MDMRATYESIGADYDDVLRRLGSDALVERFAKKFLQDQSFANLKSALAEGDAEAAFLAAHTLKGICMNLGLSNLTGPAVQITEELRGAETIGRAPELFPAVGEQYDKTVAALSA
ncbi:Hpt domain-containing protein [Paratractidigestivibacter sp.]|uniref:Hpt domain-containing protein n=1 Tax=Paratractidigestivibacter sp. TaxID=2847316 RepID=UPI002ABD5ADA|nr:Hpt domain-containing protein [Paratractidigestivibacter sp.]